MAVLAVLSRESTLLDPTLPPARLAPVPIAATHVGDATCRHCHEAEHAAWVGSHHDRAMQLPTPDATVGDFSGVSLEVGEVTSTFTTVDGAPSIVVEHDGALTTHRVHALFGTTPLQQLLIDIGDGRLQVYPIAAAAKEAAGGARWFMVHAEEALDPGDPFHWTGLLHNWNHMCAECHSTSVAKGYDEASGHFQTTSAALDVSCEACHGPGSKHVAWAAGGAKPRADAKGFLIPLRHEEASPWRRAVGEPTAHREPGERSLETLELAVCGRCHSRRSPLADAVHPGASLHDTHRLELLTEELYFADGQIRDEVFVLGSFLQSPMHAKGVTCSDCHDAHSGALHVDGNALCLGCHAPEVFDAPTHHHHDRGSPGAECVECHMPARTYMKVDPRRDHSLRVPRPDLAVTLGVPDPCLSCHEQRDSRWSSAQVVEWFPNGRSQTPHWGTEFDAIRAGAADAITRRDRLIADPSLPPIVRATALAEPLPVPPESLSGVIAALSDPDPLVRRAALSACSNAPPEAWVERALELTRDPILSVRLEATRALTLAATQRPPSENPLSALVGDRLEGAMIEFRAAARVNADRPESAMELALLALSLGDRPEARAQYRRALELEPTFGAAAVNLADLHREDQRDDEGARILERTIALSPNDAGLHYALALNRIRSRDLEGAEGSLATAQRLAPDQARYTITLALLLAETGRKEEARALLDRAIERRPRHEDLRQARAQLP